MHRIFRIAALVALSTTYTAAISQITDAQASTIAAATAQSFKASGPIEQVEVRRAEKPTSHMPFGTKAAQHLLKLPMTRPTWSELPSRNSKPMG